MGPGELFRFRWWSLLYGCCPSKLPAPADSNLANTDHGPGSSSVFSARLSVPRAHDADRPRHHLAGIPCRKSVYSFHIRPRRRGSSPAPGGPAPCAGFGRQCLVAGPQKSFARWHRYPRPRTDRLDLRTKVEASGARVIHWQSTQYAGRGRSAACSRIRRHCTTPPAGAHRAYQRGTHRPYHPQHGAPTSPDPMHHWTALQASERLAVLALRNSCLDATRRPRPQ